MICNVQHWVNVITFDDEKNRLGVGEYNDSEDALLWITPTPGTEFKFSTTKEDYEKDSEPYLYNWH